MKINQWTLGLAAVGVVSLASAVNAEEAKMNALQTALSSTTISGYVDTSVEWTLREKGFGTTPGIQNFIPFRSGKQDGFNLNVVKLTIEKPLDESEWAAGYKVDLLFGPDANGLATGSPTSGDVGYENSDFGIKNAYVALRTPIGNGIDWKMGVFDTVIGYETFEAGNNPNFTRSWGYAVEPTEHTGILGTYRINDMISVAAGVANTLSQSINDRGNFNSSLPTGTEAESWHKTFMGSIAVTAPSDMGFLAGSTLYGGMVIGINNGGSPITGVGGGDQGNYYLGATLNTPVAGLKVGASFDYVNDFGGVKQDVWVAGVYASFQATEKLSFHARAEYLEAEGIITHEPGKLYELTGTVQYDLWKNVISRLELRYDEVQADKGFTFLPDSGASLYANFIYKF